MYQHNVKVDDAELIDIMSEVADIGEDEKCEEEEIKANDKKDTKFVNPSHSDSSITDAEPLIVIFATQNLQQNRASQNIN
jgi:hypothetical protein